MNQLRVTAGVAMLLLVAFAGCTDSTSTNTSEAFSYTIPDDPSSQPVTFKANVDADRYEWNLGDSMTFLEGKEVSHTYGISDGTINVRMKAYNGEEMEEFVRAVTIGDGENQAPSFSLAINSEWVTTDEGLILDMRGISDAENDPITFRWTCTYEGPVTFIGAAHSEGGGGGFQAAPKAFDRTFIVGDEPVPESELPNDLCMPDQLGRSDYTYDEVQLLRFQEPGQYHLHMWAKDPVNPSVSTDFVFLVTDSKPGPNFQQTFTGNLTAGNGGTAQGVIDDFSEGFELDQRVHTFSLPASTLNATVQLTHTGSEPVDQVQYTLKKTGGLVKREGLGSGVSDVGTLERSSYDLIITLDQGSTVGYVLNVDIDLDLDPRKTFEFHG